MLGLGAKWGEGGFEVGEQMVSECMVCHAVVGSASTVFYVAYSTS